MLNSCFFRFNNKKALEVAKVNVMKHYAVVGVTEMWEESLEVMEHTLPFFFSGVTEIYREQQIHRRNQNQNFHKGFVSEEVKDIVRKNFSREIEFYEFCKKRLQVQLKNIKKIYM